jgi:succinyl-diaminopimelate desuccinylase
MNSLGVTGLSGEAGYTSLERRWARPTFDINGLTSGYQGEGAKTVLPARASAKFSFRLVPNQDPHKIAASLRAFLEKRLPAGIHMELIDHHGAPGVLVPLDSPYMHAAAAAIEAGFGRIPVHVREGGSIPIVTTFSRELGADVLLLGWGQNDDNTHSPNEKFNLNDYHRGTLASAHLWQELAKVPPRT